MWQDQYPTHSFAFGYPDVLTPFVEDIILPPLNSLGTLTESQLTTDQLFLDSQFYYIDLYTYPYTSTPLL
jgi:hypothetical protein